MRTAQMHRILFACISLFAVVLLAYFVLNPGVSVPVSFVWMSKHTEPNYNRNSSESPVDTLVDRYAHRSRVATDACFKSNFGQVNKVITDKGGLLANCAVAKVGCTYWINIFRYLNNQTGAKVYSSPFDIPRLITHYGDGLSVENLDNTDLVKPHLANALRFMFVRDPYSRLWSAWIDKFLLPDFWFTTGKLITKYLSSPEKEHECPKNITFVDFLRYVTRDKAFEEPQELNGHWRPYKYCCDPCLFHPHVIGKIETFGRDSRFILESVNLTWVINQPRANSLAGNHGRADHSLEEMKILTDFNIHISVHRAFMENCTRMEEVYQRLWTAFQYNGHLPASKPFPLESFKDRPLTQEGFLQVAKVTYLAWKGRTKAVQSKQKRDAMVEGYKLVHPDIMDKIRKLYDNDFESYEYDKMPEYLYDHR